MYILGRKCRIKKGIRWGYGLKSINGQDKGSLTVGISMEAKGRQKIRKIQ